MAACLGFLPFAGGPLATIASSCIGAAAFCCTSTALSAMFKSCNCNSSVATRIGYGVIFTLNSLLAWLMRTRWAIHAIEKISYDWLKMECTEGKCYGVLAVHRFCFALSLLHFILGLLLVGVKDTRDKRASIQNGWWGPKVLAWLVLVVISFVIPNEFFMVWSNYIALIGASIFILIGLVLLVDFAHTWSETCLDNWERRDSDLWKFILLGSTFGLYAATIALTGVMYAFFAGSGCGLNTFFISFNLALCILVTILSVSPPVQDANPKSGLAQAGMVAAYCTYLVTSGVVNHVGSCNPLRGPTSTTKTTTVVLGAVFTFLAIAYSTSRAATQSKALVGKKKKGGDAADGYSALDTGEAGMGVVNTQPTRKDNIRIQAMMAAIEAGAIPASALDEVEESDEEEEVTGEARDDERTGTKYNYSWFHVIFALAAMYVAMLLTDWNVIRAVGDETESGDQPVTIGRSVTAMWMRIVSSWLCFAIYSWSLVAPIVLPERFHGLD